MDWDSPTTKKHIKEAEAQGCNLLGAGKNRNYRLYRLPCGHEQEMQLVKIRRGAFRCGVCIEIGEALEARAQGCKIVGPGKSAYRIYQLPCGHEQEIRICHMRVGNFRCQICLEDRLIREAGALGYELLGAGKKPPYRIYRLPCGHEQEMQPSNLGARNRCKICLEEQLVQDAESRGCKVLGAGRNVNYRLYKLECGHEREVRIDDMRKGSFICRLCLGEKFVLEAQSRGCEILGPGINATYRLYKLPCGHERQLSVSNMRDGNFRCEDCFNEKLDREAKSHGCKIIGAGQHQGSRLYLLSCGHEQYVETGAIRKGEFACKTCLLEKYTRDAEAQGCKILGTGKSKGYRSYKLPCGHEQEVLTQKMRDGGFRCQVCQAKKLTKEAEAVGCKLLGDASRKDYRLYLLPCGHEQEIGTGSIRRGGFGCQTCIAERFRLEAEAHGCDILGACRNPNYRLYKLSCGHEQEVKIDHMRTGAFICQVCQDEKLEMEAKARGCSIRGTGRSSEYRVYELPCGHEQQVRSGHMREGMFACQACEETSRTQPSNIYLFYIKLDSDEWLKLGYAKSVTYRASSYGLPAGAEVTTVSSLLCATGNEAHAAEEVIHARYKRKRLSKKLAKEFGMVNGFAECYPVTMLDTLLAELEALKSQQES